MTNNSTLQSIIAKIPSWINAKELTIEEISGLTNQNYLAIGFPESSIHSGIRYVGYSG